MSNTTSTGPPIVKGLCLSFCRGNLCHRQRTEKGCPYIHDTKRRREAIEKKQAARTENLAAKKLHAVRAKQQEEYNKSKLSKSEISAEDKAQPIGDNAPISASVVTKSKASIQNKTLVVDGNAPSSTKVAPSIDAISANFQKDLKETQAVISKEKGTVRLNKFKDQNFAAARANFQQRYDSMKQPAPTPGHPEGIVTIVGQNESGNDLPTALTATSRTELADDACTQMKVKVFLPTSAAATFNNRITSTLALPTVPPVTISRAEFANDACGHQKTTTVLLPFPTGTASNYHISDASKLPSTQITPFEATTRKPGQKACQQFLRGRCTYQDKCRFYHDVTRTEAKTRAVDTNVSKFVGNSITISNQSSRSSSWSESNFPNPSPDSSFSYATIAAEGVVEKPTLEANSAPAKAWDAGHFYRWAKSNLRETTSIAFLAPFIRDGKIAEIRKLYTTILREYKGKDGVMFLLFSLLPYDIRHMIWVEVLNDDAYTNRIKLGYANEGPAFIPGNVTPRLLHVNRETRELAMKRYELSFGTKYHRALTWHNFDQDRLHIQTKCSPEFPTMINLILKKDRSRVTWVVAALRDYLPNQENFVRAVARFPNLQHLTLIIADVEEDREWVRATPKWAGKCKSDLWAVWKKKYRESPEHTKPGPGKSKIWIKRLPEVEYQVVDGMKAHLFYKIDGISWGSYPRVVPYRSMWYRNWIP